MRTVTWTFNRDYGEFIREETGRIIRRVFRLVYQYTGKMSPLLTLGLPNSLKEYWRVKRKPSFQIERLTLPTPLGSGTVLWEQTQSQEVEGSWTLYVGRSVPPLSSFVGLRGEGFRNKQTSHRNSPRRTSVDRHLVPSVSVVTKQDFLTYIVTPLTLPGNPLLSVVPCNYS